MGGSALKGRGELGQRAWARGGECRKWGILGRVRERDNGQLRGLLHDHRARHTQRAWSIKGHSHAVGATMAQGKYHGG